MTVRRYTADMDPAGTPGDSVKPDLTLLRRAYTQLAAAIRALPDGAEAFQVASELRDELDRIVGDAAELRAALAARVWKEEELSLGALANRIGVSKARANQFIQAAKAAETAPGPG